MIIAGLLQFRFIFYTAYMNFVDSIIIIIIIIIIKLVTTKRTMQPDDEFGLSPGGELAVYYV